MGHTPNAIRSALFVDFDNVYLSLRNFDRRAADAFAERPALWLDWLESGAHAALEDGVDPIPRRVLIRNCYLNPAAFSRQRSFFTRAAFTVVDCPSLTARGKNSADILMAMDILDAVNHPTRFDEFIILTSDADFTPVLLRLRAHDRITSVLTSTITAAAFREACDVSIDLETFAVEALGLPQEDLRSPRGLGVISEGQPPPEKFADARPDAAKALLAEVRKSGAIPTQDAHKILSRVPTFQNSYWFGMGTLKALLDDLVRHEPDLFVEMDGSLPAAIRLRHVGDPEAAEIVEPPAAPPTPEPQARQQVPEPEPEPAFSPGMARFMEDINMLVGAPKLSPENYDALFDALAMALAGGTVDRDQLLQESGANLPDGARVRRGEASFVISSLADEGVLAREDAAQLGAERLAEHFRDIVLSAVANTQRSLDENERQMLEEWLIGEELSSASEVSDETDDDAPLDAVMDDDSDDFSDGDDIDTADAPDDDERDDDGDSDDDDDDDSDDDHESEVTQQRLSSDDDDEPDPPESGEAPRDGLRLPWDRRWRSR
jgi:uncharacterized LabA/DUF88 family protein